LCGDKVPTARPLGSPDLQRFVAKRMGASIHPIDSSHVPMLSHPDFVVDVIRATAKGVQG
jgi:hypothetical protein